MGEIGSTWQDRWTRSDDKPGRGGVCSTAVGDLFRNKAKEDGDDVPGGAAAAGMDNEYTQDLR